jgi:hypothetical protein
MLELDVSVAENVAVSGNENVTLSSCTSACCAVNAVCMGAAINANNRKIFVTFADIYETPWERGILDISTLNRGLSKHFQTISLNKTSYPNGTNSGEIHDINPP